MNRIQQRRRAVRLPGEKKALERTLRQEMAQAAGAEFFQHRDPLYHVTESFQQTFDAMGLKHAAQMSAEEMPEQGSDQEAQTLREERRTGDMPDPTSARSFYERKANQDQDMIRRFSETAFQRGTMSAAVFRGTGKMMLFSCLKKTVGQSQPVREQQRKLFESSAKKRNVPGSAPDGVMFNKGFTYSAVGLVVDTLRDARRAVEDMQRLVEGDARGKGQLGADTLWNMYPFLDDSRERELLEEYETRLGAGSEELGAESRHLLQNAVSRTRALIAKKGRMKVEFINKLRFISDRAAEALAEFEEPGFTAALDTALREAAGAAGDSSDSGGGTDGGAAESGQDGADGTEPPVSGSADTDA